MHPIPPRPLFHGSTAANANAVATTASTALPPDASVCAPFEFARLPFAALIGFLWFGEVTDLWTWVGAAIIAGSSVYVAYREARLARIGRAGERR